MNTTSVSCGYGKTSKARKRPKYTGNNVRGKITIPIHAHPLVRRLIVEMNEQQTTFAEVAERSNVGVDTIRFWAGRHMPRLDTFEAALNALGYELKIVECRLPPIIPTHSAENVAA